MDGASLLTALEHMGVELDIDEAEVYWGLARPDAASVTPLDRLTATGREMIASDFQGAIGFTLDGRRWLAGRSGAVSPERGSRPCSAVRRCGPSSTSPRASATLRRCCATVSSRCSAARRWLRQAIEPAVTLERVRRGASRVTREQARSALGSAVIPSSARSGRRCAAGLAPSARGSPPPPRRPLHARSTG